MKKNGWIVSPAPFLLTRPTVSRMSLVTAITLLPQLALLAFFNDIPALITIAVATAGSILAEFCFTFSNHKKAFSDGTAILAGLLAGFLLPSTLNPLVSFAVSFTGILVARNLFGGQGGNWMNPVAAAVGIAYISQASAFPSQLVTADRIRTVGDAFGALKVDHFAQIATDQSVTGLVNTGFLGFFGIKLPEGYITLFCNSPSSIPAFRYNILTLASSIALIAMNIIDWIIPLVFLLTYSLCIRFFSLAPFVTGSGRGDILFALLTGGILFIAFYILPEYSTSPRTHAGKVVSGFLAGLIAFLVCGPGGSPAGGVFTVLIINALSPVIEYLENRYIASAEDFA